MIWRLRDYYCRSRVGEVETGVLAQRLRVELSREKRREGEERELYIVGRCDVDFKM